MKSRVSFIVALGLSCSGLSAKDSWGADSLAGVKSVREVSVVMGLCSDYLNNATAVTRDLELKLRIARIPTEDPETPPPFLLLDVRCLPVEVGTRQLGYVVDLELSLHQLSLIQKNKKLTLPATWQTSDLRICKTDVCEDSIRNSAKDLMDEFLNEFLKANSPDQTSK